MRIVVFGLISMVACAAARAQTSDQEKKLAWCLFQAERMCRADQMSKPSSARDEQETGSYCTAKAGEWCKSHG